MRTTLNFVICLLALNFSHAAESGWKELPLTKDGKVNPNWTHIGYGKFVVEDGALRTDPDPKGLGLLVYKKEKLGNCQIRVVFKTRDIRSNSGVYVRLNDRILDRVKNPGAAFDRNAAGKISDSSMEKMKESSEKEEGIWYGVHQGFEVQIAGGGDPTHGTGAIYSLAPASGGQKDASTGWKTMVITLDGERIFVDYEGQRVTTFDSSAPNLPPRKIWHEPKREHKRPQKGYIGLQTHDPGDIVWFKEISVRPLASK
jgi:hypothetical protein